MKILLIDNYDSFTFNLYHYLSSLKTKVDVIRNDEITENQIIKNIAKLLYLQVQAIPINLEIVLKLLNLYIKKFQYLAFV